MINRDNWKIRESYLKYRSEVDQLSVSSIKLEKTWLNQFLTWVDNKSFENVAKIRPAFPEYLLTTQNKNGQLSREYIRKIISCSRRFLEWVVKHKAGYKSKISIIYLDTLKVPRMAQTNKEHEAVTIEEIRAIAKAPVYSLRDQRIRAAAVFWFLSGIRIGAFVTLSIRSVNLTNLSVKQWPDLGVRTKNGKHATTYLSDIQDLIEVVREWDNLVRSNLPDSCLWFAPLSPDTGLFDYSDHEIGESRDTRARKDLKVWLDKVGLEYHSPHKFRHGFAVDGIMHAKDIGDLKAISQNLMHSNLGITDGIYGGLSNDEVGNRIKNLRKNNTKNISKKELINFIEKNF